MIFELVFLIETRSTSTLQRLRSLESNSRTTAISWSRLSLDPFPVDERLPPQRRAGSTPTFAAVSMRRNAVLGTIVASVPGLQV